ncbi:hypothetical protein DdX_15043 [Ditylenchus destructor]|uniref:Uncharacterized protein n=1 Tax=Ditylenchus destructor TaxID=166010 RepID=A0AAD4MVZ6_9BILA|nr:hypothetical protein DdX_15043 [Ditylenchus destructor]
MSTNPPQIRSYLTYLNFAETILTLAFQSVSITSMSRLVYCAAFRRKSLRGNLSASLIVYLIVHIMCSTSAVPYHVYIVLNWSPGANNYSPNLLFWLGMLPNTYYFVSPIPVFFLTLDRCLALKAPFFHNNLDKKWITVPTIATFLTVYGVCIYFFLRELPLDIEKTSMCTLFACTLLKIRAIPQQYIKLIMGCMNVLCSFHFLYALRTGTGERFKNRVVKVTMAFELCFNVFPSAFSYAFNIIFGTASGNYFGSYPVMFCTLDSACCGLYYSAIFFTKSRNIIVGSVAAKHSTTPSR